MTRAFGSTINMVATSLESQGTVSSGQEDSSTAADAVSEFLFLRLDSKTHLFLKYVTFRMLGQDPLSFSVLVFQ